MQGKRRFKSFLFALAAGAGLALASAGAQASLIGTTTGCSTSNPVWSCSALSATIGAGSELTIDLPVGLEAYFDVDFGANSLTLTMVGSSIADLNPIDLFRFSNLTSVTGLGGLTFAGLVTGMSLTDFTLNSGLLQVNVGTSFWAAGSSATITFTTAPTGVPEPATLGLLVVALGGVVMARRRREESR